MMLKLEIHRLARQNALRQCPHVAAFDKQVFVPQVCCCGSFPRMHFNRVIGDGQVVPQSKPKTTPTTTPVLTTVPPAALTLASMKINTYYRPLPLSRPCPLPGPVQLQQTDTYNLHMNIQHVPVDVCESTQPTSQVFNKMRAQASMRSCIHQLASTRKNAKHKYTDVCQ